MRFVCVNCRKILKENETIVHNSDGSYSMPLFYCEECYTRYSTERARPKTIAEIIVGR